jgi:hypothetical protein
VVQRALAILDVLGPGADRPGERAKTPHQSRGAGIDRDSDPPKCRLATRLGKRLQRVK